MRLEADRLLLDPRDVDTLVPGVVEVRAPAITQVGGRILVACDARTTPVHTDWERIGGAMAADLPNPNSLLLLRDGEPEVLRRGVLEPQTGFSDPSFVSDGERVVLFHARSADVGFFGSVPWRDDAARDTLHVELGVSDDFGATWEFSTITGDVAVEYAGVFATSGHGIVVDDVWLQPAVARCADGSTRHVTWRSTDRGRSWCPGQPCGSDCDESAIETVGESLVMSARSTTAYRSGRLGRWWSTSRDLGRSWEPVRWASIPAAAACNATLVHAPCGLLLVYAAQGRIGGRIAVHRRGGWQEFAELGPDEPFGYADALWHGEHLHIVYESAGSLRYALFSVPS